MESGPYTLHGQHSRVVLDSKGTGKQPRECENRRTVPAPHRSSSPWESGPCSTVELTLETRVQVSQLWSHKSRKVNPVSCWLQHWVAWLEQCWSAHPGRVEKGETVRWPAPLQPRLRFGTLSGPTPKLILSETCWGMCKGHSCWFKAAGSDDKGQQRGNLEETQGGALLSISPGPGWDFFPPVLLDILVCSCSVYVYSVYVYMCPLLSKKHGTPRMSLEKFRSLKEHAHPSGSGCFSLENVYYVLGLWLPGLSNLYNVLMWESQIPAIPVQILLLISHFVSRYVNTLPPLNLNDGVKLCFQYALSRQVILHRFWFY